MKMPLLDGSTIDTAHSVDYRSDLDDIVHLHEPFAREQLPWWLSYETDNGSASPTFNGLATTGGKTTVTLDTGTTSAGDTTNLVGPTINWDNWTEIKIVAYGVSLGSRSESDLQVMLSDTSSNKTLTEGFALWNANNNDRFFNRVHTGGTEQNGSTIDQGIDPTATHTYGIHLYEFTDNAHTTGHNVDWYVDGRPYDRWPEGQGFPAAQDLSVRVGVVTEDTTSDQTVEIDGLHIELVP